jgi:hypothetical protein
VEQKARLNHVNLFSSIPETWLLDREGVIERRPTYNKRKAETKLQAQEINIKQSK